MNNQHINSHEQQYLDLLKHIRDNGKVKGDRTGTGTKSVFGQTMRFNLQEGLPLLTTKKVHLKSIIHENLWFLSGSSNIRYLKENGVTIWDEWADARGELGPVYGKQWRRWEDTKLVSTVFEADKVEQLLAQGYHIRTTFSEHLQRDGCSSDDTVAVMQKEYDQIQDAMDLIKHNPDSRRIIVNAWNVGDVPGMKLPPCHLMFQFYVSTLTLDERIAMHDAIGRKEEAEWHAECQKDWMQQEFRTYRYGRSLWPDDHEEAHKALDHHTTIPRKKLSCMLNMRSADMFLGVPFNLMSYAMLAHMFAQQADMAVGDFIWVGGDVHIYSNHTEQVEEQLSREPRAMAQLVIKRKPASIFDYRFEDFEIVGYDPHPAIKAPVAV